MSDYVSEDSFLLIFKHLPVKTLLRFRCVCKWWKGLIDSNSFMLGHLSVQKPRFIADYEVPNQFLVIDTHPLPLVETLTAPIRDEPEPTQLHLLGTLHGVVCLSNNKNEYLLWNPSIRKSSSIPLPESIQVELSDYEEKQIVYALPNFFEWDVGEMATFSAFWIDPSTKHFKIITFRTLRTDEDCDTPLHGIFYSSIDPDWYFVQDMDPIFFNCSPVPMGTPPVMVGDVAYWRAHSLEVDYDEVLLDEFEDQDAEAVVLSFDFVKERFGYIRVANKDYSGHFQPVLCRLNDQLSLVYWDSDAPFRFEIYSWKGEDTWVKMLSVGLLHPKIFHVFWVLDEMKGSCRALAIDGPEKALVYFGTKDRSSVALRGVVENPAMYVVYDFVESLLFPSTQPA